MPDPDSLEDIPLRSRAEHGAVLAGNLLLPRLAGYEIVRLLAEGGMGVVYEAWQVKPRRRVALKLLRPGLVTPALLRRFGREIELLGRLEHPAIARIYEAGADNSGGISQPFFAMEYIEGCEITQFVRDQDLDIRERIALFKRVVDGVHYAHQKGIIHRDLKPGNVSVDASGTPKILDFGVARAIEAEDQFGTLTQDKSALFGTLQYMSPEQATGQNAEVDIRSDVYALGVMLFELLAGERPFRLNTTSIPEAVRIVHETEPLRLGTFGRALRGDLEIIVSTAMAKDKDRRYSSAAALADDLQRYWDSEPILAHAPSAWYRIGKFVRRNKILVGAAVSIFAALALGLVFTSIALARARRAEAEAVTQRNQAQSNLQQTLDTVDQFAVYVAKGPLANIPETGPIQENLLRDAIFFFMRLANNSLDDKQLFEIARRLIDCGSAFSGRHNPSDAEQAFSESMRIMRNLCDRHPHDREYLLLLENIWHRIGQERASAHRYDEAIAAVEESVGIMDELVAFFPGDPQMIRILAANWNKLGQLHVLAQHYNRAIDSNEHACRLRLKLTQLQPDNISFRVSLARSYFNSGRTHFDSGNTNQAAACFAQAYELYKSILREAPGEAGARRDLPRLLESYTSVLKAPAMSKLFQEMIPAWEQLSRDYPQEAYIQESLRWMRARLQALESDTISAAFTSSEYFTTPIPDLRAQYCEMYAPGNVPKHEDSSASMIDALDLETLRRHIGHIRTVHGRVVRVGIEPGLGRCSHLFFSLTPDRFAGAIPRNALPAFVEAYGEGLSGLASRNVELTGPLTDFSGTPQIMLTRLEQVRLLDVAESDADVTTLPLPPTISSLDDAALRTNVGPVVVEGRISHISQNPEYVYLRFDKSKGERFTAVIPHDCVSVIEHAHAGSLTSIFFNATAQISGIIYFYHDTPCIEIRSPDQIKVLDSP